MEQVRANGCDVEVKFPHIGHWVRIRTFESEDSARAHRDWLADRKGLIKTHSPETAER